MFLSVRNAAFLHGEFMNKLLNSGEGRRLGNHGSKANRDW